MKALSYILGLIYLVTIIIFSCSKKVKVDSGTSYKTDQMELTEEKSKYNISYIDEFGVRQINTVIDSSLSILTSHGDLFYDDFPELGIYQWAFDLNGKNFTNTMYITEVGDHYFIGYVEDHYYDTMVMWIIDHGTINNDGSITFNVDFSKLLFPYYSFTGSFRCGLGITGSVYDNNADSIGSWKAYRIGNLRYNKGSEEKDLLLTEFEMLKRD